MTCPIQEAHDGHTLDNGEPCYGRTFPVGPSLLSPGFVPDDLPPFHLELGASVAGCAMTPEQEQAVDAYLDVVDAMVETQRAADRLGLLSVEARRLMLSVLDNPHDMMPVGYRLLDYLAARRLARG